MNADMLKNIVFILLNVVIEISLVFLVPNLKELKTIDGSIMLFSVLIFSFSQGDSLLKYKKRKNIHANHYFFGILIIILMSVIVKGGGDFELTMEDGIFRFIFISSVEAIGYCHLLKKAK